MRERSGAPSGFSPASIVISKPPVAFNCRSRMSQITVTHPTSHFIRRAADWTRQQMADPLLQTRLAGKRIAYWIPSASRYS